MKEILGKVDDNMIINTDVQIRGMVVGNVTVEKNGFLKLNGMIIGKLDVFENAVCELHGMVEGDVENHGGELVIYGMIHGNLTKHKGITNIQLDAKINGTIFEDNS